MCCASFCLFLLPVGAKLVPCHRQHMKLVSFWSPASSLSLLYLSPISLTLFSHHFVSSGLCMAKPQIHILSLPFLIPEYALAFPPLVDTVLTLHHRRFSCCSSQGRIISLRWNSFHLELGELLECLFLSSHELHIYDLFLLLYLIIWYCIALTPTLLSCSFFQVYIFHNGQI